MYDGNGALVTRFEYAADRMPVAMETGGATYYLAYDQVGSLRAVVDTSGTVVREITYDSFGNILSETGSGPSVPFGFAGGLHDRDTALVRFGFRDYDPDVGRWTAKDPIGFDGGDTNLYAYVANAPVSFIDPLGLFYWAPAVIGAAIGGTAGFLSAWIAGGCTGENIDEIIRATLIGAGVGAISAYLGPLNGALLGFTSNLAIQILNGATLNTLDFGSLAISTLAGGVGARVGGTLGAGPRGSSFVNKGLGPVSLPAWSGRVQQVRTAAIGGATAGVLDVGLHTAYNSNRFPANTPALINNLVSFSF